QAEDGIRDDLVTGVQTCALPICPDPRRVRLRGPTSTWCRTRRIRPSSPGGARRPPASRPSRLRPGWSRRPRRRARPAPGCSRERPRDRAAAAGRLANGDTLERDARGQLALEPRPGLACENLGRGLALEEHDSVGGLVLDGADGRAKRIVGGEQGGVVRQIEHGLLYAITQIIEV